ncbi:hypothetical protein [Hydrogenophaga pseudoflava]|uniref:Uncharacterized protein n=1 Tax=Hydrogenophaga pseudoflava TaxID=47421 RepID=A0A4P6WW36_HYDPS|nr:hypothetical protein [Hydrogenophaga pseudoflava]QBM27680.1 hypothetical protein HPF_08290 [Hydrogenophaga pseudoflava]
MNTSLRRLALSAFAAGALLSALPAQAIGRLADVHLIDRDSGETLPVYRYRGEHWVAGRPGARYAISVRNAQPNRLMGVVSVDGVNVVSGETAAWHQTGYVLGPWQQYDITGWRKSDHEVAAFHFTALPSSYAARTGRPAHVGVIGVALFREKAPALEPLPEPVYPSWRERRELNEAESGSLGRGPRGRGTPSAWAADSVAEARRPAPAAPKLGTGHGEREHDTIGHTTFERRSDRPEEVIRIRYDSRENLVAMGILPPDVSPHRPQPFPGSRSLRYAPDPD